MRRALSVLSLAAVLAAAPLCDALAQQQAPPPSGPRDRRPVHHNPPEAQPEAPKPPKPRRNWPGRGNVVVVPPSELSSSPERTRGPGPGIAPPGPMNAAALVGFDEVRLKAALGQPSLARNEGQGSLWTYRLRTCALHVFLARDTAGALRVKGAASGPLVRGAPTPAVDACIAEAKR